MHDEATGESPLSKEAVALLVENHRDFLRYVERRVGDPALAEDIVQDAFVKNLERSAQIQESVVGWFYRVLRNAVIDRQRRRAVQSRRLEALASELESAGQASAELANVACACVARLADTLKPEYAEALRQIEVAGTGVAEYAAAQGITPSNAGVRIFRAREALRKQVARSCGTCAEHGCLDCTCEAAPASRGLPATLPRDRRSDKNS